MPDRPATHDRLSDLRGDKYDDNQSMTIKRAAADVERSIRYVFTKRRTNDCT